MSQTTQPDWKLQGGYFETCNCEAACPCVWFQPPTEGECKLLVAWHIDNGHLEQLRLDDLNVALACYAPGHMKDGGWHAALYIDERADARQEAAIARLFGGQAGGHPAILMSFVSDVLGVHRVKIDYREEGEQRHLHIPDIAQATIEGIKGINGELSSIANPPLCVVASHPTTVGRSKQYEYHDHGHHWSFSERNGYYSPFTYQP